MKHAAQTAGIRSTRYRLGWILSGLAIAFLLLDSIMKLLALPVVLQASGALGFVGPGMARGLGMVLLVCTALYAAPRTAIFGAILLTGYLGGAVAAHLRAGDPLVTHVLFGVYAGVLVWSGLYLRDSRLSTLIPVRSPLEE